MIPPDKKFWKVDRPVILLEIGGSDIRGVKVPDDSILVGYEGRPMMVAPQFVISPEGRYEPWEIKTMANGQPEGVTVGGLTCTHCQSKEDKPGYRVVAPAGQEEVDVVVQCQNCRGYLFVAKGKRQQ